MKNTTRLIILICFLLFLGPNGCAQTPNNIVLNPAIRYQTMSGWEATAQAGQFIFADWNTYKTSLMDQAAADGINRFRLQLKHNTEANSANLDGSVNDNADPFSINASGFQWSNKNGIDGQVEVINMMRSRLAARGETLYVNLCYVDFQNYAFEHHANPEEYAELIEATFLHLSSTYGWVPDAVEIILEPDAGENTSEWTATKMANCLLATQRRLAGHGWNPRFIVPSTTSCPNADVWYNNIKAAQPSATQFIDELSYHRYAPCDATTLAQNQTAAEANGNRTAMLEMIGAGYTHLHTDLKANAVAWQQYALAFDIVNPGDDGSQYYLVNHTTHAVTISSRMKFLRQYFKYIRRGAVRIDATSNSGRFDPVAFINTDGKYVVVNKATRGGDFNVVGLPAGTYDITYTTTSQYDFNLSTQTIGSGGIVTTNIPAAGVITIYATTGRSPTPTQTPSPLQLILDKSGPEPNQMAALDSVLFLRDPFPVVNGANLFNLGLDRNTRVIIFLTNLQLVQGETPSSVVVNLIDSNNQSYDIAAEDVRPLPNFEFTEVIFRLPDNLPAGTCTIKMKAHGQVSTTGTMRIGI